MGYNPWADAASRFPEIHIEKSEIAPIFGAWVPTEQVILLGRHLTIAQTWETLAHEIAHIDLGHRQCAAVGPDGGRLSRRNERAADELAARRLISITDLADCAGWTSCCCEMADHLRVTRAMMLTRLSGMSDDERRVLGARGEHWAA